MTLRSGASLYGLCALMGVSGILHLVAPAPYRRIVPHALRSHAGALVAISGLGEIACTACLLVPATRRAGSLLTAVLLVAVFPANIQMALDQRDNRHAIVTWLRLPIQLPLILWALSFRRSGAAP